MQADWLLILCLTPQQKKMSKKMQYINAWHARIQKKIIPGGKIRRLPAFAGGGGGGAVTYIW